MLTNLASTKRCLATLIAGVIAQVSLATYGDNPYVLGASAAIDTADSHSVGVLANYSISESTTLSADAGLTRVNSEPGTLTNTFWNLSIEKELQPAGVSVTVGQWGDKDAVTSDRWSLGLFRNFDHARLSVEYVSQHLDITFQGVQDSARQTQASATGTGPNLYASVFTDEGRALWLSASQTSYNRPVSRLGQLRIARLLSPSSLSLSSTLLDHSVSLGADWPVGEKLMSLSLGRDRTAVDLVDIDSLTLGWLTPVGARTDLDIGLGVSRDAVDTQVFLSFLLLRYGGVD